MSFLYDATAKDFLEVDPSVWPGLLVRPCSPGSVRLGDSDLSTVSTATDRVILIDDPAASFHTNPKRWQFQQQEMETPWWNVSATRNGNYMVECLSNKKWKLHGGMSQQQEMETTWWNVSATRNGNSMVECFSNKKWKLHGGMFQQQEMETPWWNVSATRNGNYMVENVDRPFRVKKLQSFC